MEEMWCPHNIIYEAYILQGQQQVHGKDLNRQKECGEGHDVVLGALGVWKSVLKIV